MTDQLSSRLAAVALVVAPILLLAATVLFTTFEGGMNEGQIGGAILVWAMITFAVGLLGLVRRLEASAPRGAALLGLLVLVGCAGGVGFGIDSMHAALPGGANLLDTDGALVPLALAIPGALFPLTVAATGLAAGRAGLIGRWSAVLIVVGALLFPASRVPNIEALAILADLVLVAGLAPVGAAQLAGRQRGVAGRSASAAV